MSGEQEARDPHEGHIWARAMCPACEEAEDAQAARRDEAGCEHCPDGHRVTQPWHVRVASERDGDGQPIYLRVEPCAGAHVAESDAEMVRSLLNGQAARDAEWRENAQCTLDADKAAMDRDAETIAGLRAWKDEALPVMAGLQDLGRILGVRLGTSITGESAAQAARALVARADAAEARVRAVEDLWDRETSKGLQFLATFAVVPELRAALATPEPTCPAYLLGPPHYEGGNYGADLRCSLPLRHDGWPNVHTTARGVKFGTDSQRATPEPTVQAWPQEDS